MKRTDIDEMARRLLVATANYVTEPNSKNKRRVTLALNAHSRAVKRWVRLNALPSIGSGAVVELPGRDAFVLAGTDAQRTAKGGA